MLPRTAQVGTQQGFHSRVTFSHIRCKFLTPSRRPRPSVLSQSRAATCCGEHVAAQKKYFLPVQGHSPRRPVTIALSSRQGLHPLKSQDISLLSRINVQQRLGRMTNVERDLGSPSSLMHCRQGCYCEKQSGGSPKG